jgi:RecB family exonuclease
VPLVPQVLLCPSSAAAAELPRRLASTGRALAGIYPLKILDLARAIAEPALLGRGLAAWDSGHDALLAGRLLAGPHGLRLDASLPRGPVAAALARTLAALRRAGIPPERVKALADAAAATPEDESRLGAVAELYQQFHDVVEGRFADTATLVRAARDHLREAEWLKDAEVLVVGEPELDPLERELLAALARSASVEFVELPRPPGLAADSFGTWARGVGARGVTWEETRFAPAAAGAPPGGLARLAANLFEPPEAEPARDGSVELLTAAGEAAEVRAIVRVLLREAARGVPFEEMGVILPDPRTYAPLFTDLLTRLEIPHRLHPSLPLRYGRSARSLLLLLRCRGLERTAVMEFLTFAPIPFAGLLGESELARPAVWDAISRDAGVVSELPRWLIGLRSYAEQERDAAAKDEDAERRERRKRRADDAENLLRVVELLSAALDKLSGEASWPEWAARLTEVAALWIGPERDSEAVKEVVADLAALGSLEARVPWQAVEDVVEARLEWERLPLAPVSQGAVHVGALDAMAGLPFRVVAIPGLVEGGYPGTLRQDPFLLDHEREALAVPAATAGATEARTRPGRRAPTGQLSLFEPAPAEPEGVRTPRRAPLPTSQDRLTQARRLFHRACAQATERLVLSYPRADSRSGRERMPSLFLLAAATALEARPLESSELLALVREDDAQTRAFDLLLDGGERDRGRVLRGGAEAALQIAAGSRFFRQSHLSAHARWSRELTPYDGLVAFAPRDGEAAETARRIRAVLDPTASPLPISATKLATFSRCGFLYLLQYVLRLEPALEPEERKRLEPLERGNLFHGVAEAFLRDLRRAGRLPLRGSEEERERLLELADRALAEHVSGTPPRYTVLWEREQRRFRETLLAWWKREIEAAERGAVPAHFEVAFGMSAAGDDGEPHASEPLEIELGDGRRLRVAGKIDRIDRRPDGALVLRDYKTGKAPRDEGGVFRGGKQLQIPFYILAAGKLLPGAPVVEAFLDYVDGGRQVAFPPERVHDESFRAVLRGLVDAIADGVFLQEHTACDFCDYKVVCGPAPLLAQRREFKLSDPRVQRVLRLRSL